MLEAVALSFPHLSFAAPVSLKMVSPLLLSALNLSTEMTGFLTLQYSLPLTAQLFVVAHAY
jgi:uncharacterized membrane protein